MFRTKSRLIILLTLGLVVNGCTAGTRAAVVRISDPVVRVLCSAYPALRGRMLEVDSDGGVRATTDQ